MICPVRNRQPETLLDYVRGRLSPEAATALEAHLRVCAQCSRIIESQRQVWSALSEWQAAPVSGKFDSGLYARIEEQHAERFWRPFFRARPGSLGVQRILLPFSAVLVTVFAAMLFRIPSSFPIPSYEEEARSDLVEAEQIDRTLEDLDMLRQLSAPLAASKQP